MKKLKVIYLAVILTILIGVSVGLSFWEGDAGRTQVNSTLFAIKNIDQIDRIVLTRGQQILDFRAFSQGFMINDKYPMDENLLTVLASVLQQVRVQRPLSANEQQGTWTRLKGSGTHVEVFSGDQMLASYWAGGDDLKRNSYFGTEEGEVYLVNLPGYTSYVSGLYELSLPEWRSKTVFFSTWRSLLSYQFENFYQPEDNFEIKYSDPFFSVTGVQKLDSNRVINYLQQLGSLRALSLIDTTYQGDPWLKLSTTDINDAKNNSLLVFGEPSQNMILGKVNDQFYLFRSDHIKPLIQSPPFFQSEN